MDCLESHDLRYWVWLEVTRVTFHGYAENRFRRSPRRQGLGIPISLVAKGRMRPFRPSQCDEAASPPQRARASELGRVPVNNIDRTTKPDNSISEYDIVRGHYDHLRGDAEDLAAGAMI